MSCHQALISDFDFYFWLFHLFVVEAACAFARIAGWDCSLAQVTSEAEKTPKCPFLSGLGYGPRGRCAAPAAASDLFLRAQFFSFIRERAAFYSENIQLASVKAFPPVQLSNCSSQNLNGRKLLWPSSCSDPSWKVLLVFLCLGANTGGVVWNGAFSFRDPVLFYVPEERYCVCLGPCWESPAPSEAPGMQ